MRRRKKSCLGKLLTWCLIILLAVSGIKYGVKRLYPLTYRDTVESAAAKYDVSPALLFALIKAESNFNPNAVSGRGAKGLMQLMDETASWCAEKTDSPITDITDPAENIPLGAYYLSYLLRMYNGNVKSAVAAYNAGHGRVDAWLSSQQGEELTYIPFAETDRYVKKVLFYEKIYRRRLM